jgi:hypothetical protein
MEQFSRTSVDADSILLDRAAATRRNTAANEESEDTPEQWHSIALIFVALPALAGVFFENGSAVVTDMLMLGLGCLFLYWSVKWPWYFLHMHIEFLSYTKQAYRQWYYSTQELKLADEDPTAEFAVLDESDDELDAKSPPKSPDTKDKIGDNEKKTTAATESFRARGQRPSRSDLKRGEAVKALQSLEIMALSSCFLSPAAVAYMLHSIRPYLSRPSGGVVSNSNLTLFVLAAELRPVLHFFRLVEERTFHLQRIVTSLPASEEKQLEERVEALAQRIEEFETKSPLARPFPAPGGISGRQDLTVTSPQASSDLERSLRQSLQPQLDALTRAVRRYEKRATTQAIVTEARLQDLEARLKDALSLAAAVSRNSQKSSLLQQTSDLVKWMLTKPLEALSQIMLLPFQIAGDVWRFLVGPRRKKKKMSGAGTGTGQNKWANEFKGKQRMEAR